MLCTSIRVNYIVFETSTFVNIREVGPPIDSKFLSMFRKLFTTTCNQVFQISQLSTLTITTFFIKWKPTSPPTHRPPPPQQTINIFIRRPPSSIFKQESTIFVQLPIIFRLFYFVVFSSLIQIKKKLIDFPNTVHITQTNQDRTNRIYESFAVLFYCVSSYFHYVNTITVNGVLQTRSDLAIVESPC